MLLGWMIAVHDTRWIAQLYRATATRSGSQFRQWALDALTQRVAYAAAVWCVRENDTGRLTATTVRGLAPSVLEPLLALGSAQWLPPAGEGTAGRSWVTQRDLQALGAQYPQAAAVHARGLGQSFVALCPQSDTLFTTVICLLRRSVDPAFSFEDGDTLRTLLPHLAEAESLALENQLQFDDRLAATGRRNRGACCLADASGRIRSMSTGFHELLQRHVPDWDGLHLPFELEPLADAQERNLLVPRGLHVRVVRADQDLLQIHVRPTHPFDSLTAREHDIVKAMINGGSYKALARELGVSASTVANHASNIYRKLGAYNRDQVVGLASSFDAD